MNTSESEARKTEMRQKKKKHAEFNAKLPWYQSLFLFGDRG